jgi:hypothetical protein
VRTACLCWTLVCVVALCLTSMARGQACNVPLPTSCWSDIDGDQAIEVDDLVAVILGWGQVGPPRPEADVAPLPNGDCTVNVDDLVEVVLTWGECAPGLINDNCAGAIALQVGLAPAPPAANNYSNADATNGTVPGPAMCLAGGPANFTRDVWFKHTVPTGPDLAGHILTFDLCGTPDPFINTVMAAYTGSCASLTQIACNDNAPTCGSNNLRSRITTELIPPGTTVFIRVGSWSTSATNQGPFVLSAQAQEITNDQCLGAVEIPIGGSVSGSLEDATQDFAESCDGVSIGRSNWYTVIGDGTTLTASTCNSVPGVYDGTLSVYCAGAAGCSALNCVAATNEDLGNPQGKECPAFQGEEVSWCAQDGQTYWIAVSVVPTGLPEGEPGVYTLTVTSDSTPGCTIKADCNEGVPPANEDCATATVVQAGNTPFSNAIAMPQGVGAGNICGQPWSKDVWFKYTSSNGGTVGLAIVSDPAFDTMVQVFTATSTCAAPVQLVCEDDDASCGACHPIISWTATPGATYLIRVMCWSDSEGGFANLSISDP